MPQSFVSDSFVLEMLADAQSDLEAGNPFGAYAKADQALALADSATLLSESPQIIVNRARALRERAELATMYMGANFDAGEGLSDELTDLESAWFEQGR